jgi:hypothetical protein
MLRRFSGNHILKRNLLVMRIFLLVIVLVLSSTSYAADGKAMMEQEIQHLFDHLKNSDCEFNRNGKWYDAEKAVKHIDRKYQYLIIKGLVNSTEQFIERAASESSMSGKPYEVKCGESEPVKSSVWFNRELTNFREKNQQVRVPGDGVN